MVFLSILGVAARPASADFREVSPTGSNAGGNGCRVDETPCATIHHAIEIAEVNDTVDVAPGVYGEEVVIDKPLTLRGPTIGFRRGEPEAVVESGTGTGIRVGADGVEIVGMTVESTRNGTGVRTSGPEVDGLATEEDFILGGATGVSLETGGEGDSVGFDVFEGVGDAIRLSGAEYTDLSIRADQFLAPMSGYAVLAGSGTTIKGLELSDDEMTAPTRIAARVEKNSDEESDIDGNSFQSTRGPQLAIDADDVRVMENTFEGQGTTGCLQILGDLEGLLPSDDLLISGDNVFEDCSPYGIEVGPEVEQVAIYGNRFPGSYDGVTTSTASPWDVTGRVRLLENRFFGTTHLAVDNTASGTLDAEQNWWGCNDGPGAAGCDRVSAGVDAGDEITFEGRIGPRKPETGIVELPTGRSITLNPGEQAEVAAFVTRDGSEPDTGPPFRGTSVNFSSSLGTLRPASGYLQNGWTTTFFTAGATPGQGSIAVDLDGQQTLIPVIIRGEGATGPPSSSRAGSSVPTAPTPPTAADGTVPAPTLKAAVGRVVLEGRLATVGSVSCAESCLIAPGSVAIVIHGHGYRASLGPRGMVAAGSRVPVRVILPPRTVRALKTVGSGRLRARLTVTDASGQTVTRTISVTLSPARAG